MRMDCDDSYLFNESATEIIAEKESGYGVKKLLPALEIIEVLKPVFVKINDWKSSSDGFPSL